METNQPEERMRADEARALVNVLVDDVTEVLDRLIQSVILHGSLASGAYVPGNSDIDVLFVVSASLGKAAKERSLQVVSRHFDGRGAGLDLRVTTVTMAAEPERLPAIDLEIGVHAPQFEATIVADKSTDTDLLIEFAVCRGYGESLRGPQ